MRIGENALEPLFFILRKLFKVAYLILITFNNMSFQRRLLYNCSTQPATRSPQARLKASGWLKNEGMLAGSKIGLHNIAHCNLHIVICTLHSVYCSVHSVLHTLHSAHCNLHIVLRAVQFLGKTVQSVCLTTFTLVRKEQFNEKD